MSTEAERYALPDDMYDSKDWRASPYAGRVEWLHFMYESKKQEIEDLLNQPQREWVGLTDAEVQEMFGQFTAMTGKGWCDLYRMAEAKLKEKNT